MVSSRRFTEKETSEIIRKAAEQHARGAGNTGQEGVTETELRAAAKELGIESSAVDIALRDYDALPLSDKPGFWGGPYRREQEFIMNGTIDEDRWEEIVMLTRSTFGETGKVERRGATYEWTATGGGAYSNTVTIRQSGTSLRVKVSSEFSFIGFLAFTVGFLPLLISVVFVSKAKLPFPWGPIVGWGLAIIYFLAMRAWTASFSRRHDRNVNRFTERMQEILALDEANLMQSVVAEPLILPDGDELTMDQ